MRKKNIDGRFDLVLVNGIIWGTASAVIGYAIKRTGRLTPLLTYFLLPTFSTAKTTVKDDDVTILDEEEETNGTDINPDDAEVEI